MIGLTLGLGVGSAHAAPTPSPSGSGGSSGGKPTKVCTITDPRLRELSGLVATENGYIVVNDSTDDPARRPVFFLNKKCQVTKEVPFPTPPLDPEDLALSPDGKTLWIADIGDNATAKERRSRIALWSMPVDGSKPPVIHRVSYPQNQPRDAEALLIADDGTPIIITKTLGKAEIFVPTGPLRQNNEDPVPLQKVGELSLPKTTTVTPLGAAGRIPVTGAARSPDGTRVVLRTYGDAFEWDVPDGDIVAALTTGTPRVTPLADKFGEAITYTPDGAYFLTVSDVGALAGDVDVVIQRYEPSTTMAKATEGDDGDAGPSWIDRLTLQDINLMIGGVGLFGALLVAIGIAGILVARRGRGQASGGSSGRERVLVPETEVPSEDTWEDEPKATTSPVGAGGVYGASGRARPGGVYGGGGVPSSGGSSGRQGTVYGGGAANRPSGGIYGAGAGDWGSGGAAERGGPPRGPLDGGDYADPGRRSYPEGRDEYGRYDDPTRSYGGPARGYASPDRGDW